MLVVDVVDGVPERFLLSSCGWLAGRQLEKNPLNKMYSTVLLPPVYNRITRKISQVGRRVWMELLLITLLRRSKRLPYIYVYLTYRWKL